MAWVNDTFPVISFTTEFANLIGTFGWLKTLKFRAVADNSAQSKSRSVAEVTLFSSLGTDSQIRRLGMIHSYGNSAAVTSGNEVIIPADSPLGTLSVVADSNRRKFKTSLAPIVPHLFKIYIGGVEQLGVGQVGTNIENINYTTGEVTFLYSIADNVTASFGLVDAVTPPEKIWFFTFDDVLTEKLIEEESMTADTDPLKWFFDCSSVKPSPLIIKDSLKTYAETEYTFYTGNPCSVVFNSGITVVGGVKASYIKEYQKGSDNSISDIEVPTFNPANGKETCEAVLSSLRFVFPSPPTTVSFVDTFSNGITADTDLEYWGNITRNRMALFFRLDSAADASKCLYVPLYIGKLTPLGTKIPKKDNVIIGGALAEDSVAVVGLTVNGSPLNYGPFSTNGNDGVLLQQTIGGARNQKHYLSFITHDVKAELSMESRYNPSVYSGRYHISPMYIVHPDDGFVGMLDEVLAVHPKNIQQLDELEIRESVSNEIVGIGDGVTNKFFLRHTPYFDPTADAGLGKLLLSISIDCVEIPMSLTEVFNYNNSSPQEYFTNYDKDADAPELGVAGIKDANLKMLVFKEAPLRGEVIYSNYTYQQIYAFALPTTPDTPYRNETVSPYTPIGLAILKSNKPFDV